MLFFLFVVFGSLLAVNAQICLLDNCTLAGLQGVFFERSSIECMGLHSFQKVDGSGSGSNGNPALCVSPEAVLVYLKASDTCESGCFNLYVSWYSTFGQQLGGYHAAPGPCINGNYTFQYSPLVEALYRLEPVYNGIPVQTGSCDCPKHKAIGITVSSCSRCAAPPGDPCSPEAGKPHYKSYDAANNVPGGSQLVFDYSRK